MRGELRKITGSQRLCLLLVLAVLCSGVLFALHATGDSGGYTAVSYTHLDVYKRQVWCCFYCWPCR